MSKKSKRKDKKKHLCPPLTLLDKSSYLLCFIISCLGAFLFIICFDYIRSVIAFSRADTVAYRSTASSLFSLTFVLYLEISALVFFICAWESKKPIFGSKKYKYGEYPYKEDCVPFFHRKKYNINKKPSQKRFARQMVALWCSILVFAAGLIPFGLFGRNALYEDNHIEKINLINLTSDTYTTEDFAHLTIRAYKNRTGRYHITGFWTYAITIETKGGEEFSFSRGDFNSYASGSQNISLDKMLEIKSLFDSDSITITGAENTPKVVERFDLDETQQAKLDRLFAMQAD